MAPVPITYRFSKWSRALSVLLVGVLLLNGLPLGLVGQEPHSACPCEQRGFCPMNPGEACACSHHAAEGDVPAFRACGDMGIDAWLGRVAFVKGFLPQEPSVEARPPARPRPSDAALGPPRERADDIFHPPRRIG